MNMPTEPENLPLVYDPTPPLTVDCSREPTWVILEFKANSIVEINIHKNYNNEKVKEIYKLAIKVANDDPDTDANKIENEIFSVIDFYGDYDNLKEFDRKWIDELRKKNKPDMGLPRKFFFKGYFFDYFEEFMSSNELWEEAEKAVENEIDLEEYILDGFFECEYEVERYFEQSRFVVGYRGGLVILEDSNNNIVTRFNSRDFKKVFTSILSSNSKDIIAPNPSICLLARS